MSPFVASLGFQLPLFDFRRGDSPIRPSEPALLQERVEAGLRRPDALVSVVAKAGKPSQSPRHNTQARKFGCSQGTSRSLESKKLVPWFVGPFEVEKMVNGCGGASLTASLPQGSSRIQRLSGKASPGVGTAVPPPQG